MESVGIAWLLLDDIGEWGGVQAETCHWDVEGGGGEGRDARLVIISRSGSSNSEVEEIVKAIQVMTYEKYRRNVTRDCEMISWLMKNCNFL